MLKLCFVDTSLSNCLPAPVTEHAFLSSASQSEHWSLGGQVAHGDWVQGEASQQLWPQELQRRPPGRPTDRVRDPGPDRPLLGPASEVQLWLREPGGEAEAGPDLWY